MKQPQSTQKHVRTGPNRPLVAILGGPRLHSRLDLLDHLCDRYEFVGVGSPPHNHELFAQHGFAYHDWRLPRVFDPVGDLNAFRRIIALLEELRPSLVHTFGGKASVGGRLAARFVGTPAVVGTLTGLGSLYMNPDLRRLAMRKAYEHLQKTACRHSDLTIFQNRADLNDYVGRGLVPSAKAALIPGGGLRADVFDPCRASPSERAAARASAGIGATSTLVLTVARVVPTKGISELARAAKIVKSRCPGVQFAVAGGVDTGSIDRFSSSGLEEIRTDVRLLGERRNIPPLLASSDNFVFPTPHREGMPRAVLEAMAMKLPVVATDVPGCNEAIENCRSGLLVPPGDVKALAEAILRLIENPDLRTRLGSETRNRVLERFEISLIARQLSDSYETVLAKAGLSRV